MQFIVPCDFGVECSTGKRWFPFSRSAICGRVVWDLPLRCMNSVLTHVGLTHPLDSIEFAIPGQRERLGRIRSREIG